MKPSDQFFKAFTPYAKELLPFYTNRAPTRAEAINVFANLLCDLQIEANRLEFAFADIEREAQVIWAARRLTGE